MHKVFAGSAIALLAATIVMMDNDESREWREYQFQAEEIRREKLERDLEALGSMSFTEEMERLEDKQLEAQAAYEKKSGEVATLESQLSELTGLVELLERQVKFQNAEVGVSRANRGSPQRRL